MQLKLNSSVTKILHRETVFCKSTDENGVLLISTISYIELKNQRKNRNGITVSFKRYIVNLNVKKSET